MKLLVPIDGSPGSLRAAAWAVKRAARAGEGKVLLLNVQAPIRSGNISRYVTRAMIEDYRREQGERALAKARRLLGKSGVSHVAHIVTGHIAESIVEHARRERCSEIVMGTRGMGRIATLVLGSIATKVVHLARVPVTVVR